MSQQPLPLVILGGRDRRPARLPEAGRDLHPIQGYKAMDLVIGGRPLIHLLVERLRRSSTFDPILVAGPRRVYAGCARELELEVVDTDGTFGENIRAAFQAIDVLPPTEHVAFTTCDVLPDPQELAELLQDFRRHQPLDFWMPQIRVPPHSQALGESQWKPRYRLVPEGEEQPVDTLPGHLILVDPQAIRRNLLFRLFDLSYRTRNRSVAHRRTVIARHLLPSLLLADLRQLGRLEAPGVTWDVAVNGLAIARGLRAGTMGAAELARRVRRVYVHRRHRRLHPERRGRMPVLHGLSLAKDIDTQEEAREVERVLQQTAASEKAP